MPSAGRPTAPCPACATTSANAPSAGPALRASRALADHLLDFAAAHLQLPRAEGHFGGTPRSVAFNAQWFRVPVDPDTGEIRILRRAHAADAGKVMSESPFNPVAPAFAHALRDATGVRFTAVLGAHVAACGGRAVNFRRRETGCGGHWRNRPVPPYPRPRVSP